MKINIAKFEPDRIGGGWSWSRNFAKGMGDSIVSYEESEIYLIPSPSMVQRDEVNKAKADGKKIVLRVDNAVRNSRNRNTGMSRLKEFSELADKVIYQSDWARDYIMEFTHIDGDVILNGVDTDLFKPGNNAGEHNYLYSRFNRDETKNWEVARYFFSRTYARQPQAKLFIVGQFSPELREYNFDFYNGENYQFLGVQTPEVMADLYRQCKKFIYTYVNDACSNSLIEALVSGCQIVGYDYWKTGGGYEIVSQFNRMGRDYFSIERMCADYKKVLESIYYTREEWDERERKFLNV